MGFDLVPEEREGVDEEDEDGESDSWRRWGWRSKELDSTLRPPVWPMFCIAACDLVGGTKSMARWSTPSRRHQAHRFRRQDDPHQVSHHNNLTCMENYNLRRWGSRGRRRRGVGCDGGRGGMWNCLLNLPIAVVAFFFLSLIFTERDMGLWNLLKIDFFFFGRVGLLKGCEFFKESISSCELWDQRFLRLRWWDFLASKWVFDSFDTGGKNGKSYKL